MFCTKCGNQIAEGMKFCIKCGAPVVRMEGASKAPVQEPKREPIRNEYQAPKMTEEPVRKAKKEKPAKPVKERPVKQPGEKKSKKGLIIAIIAVCAAAAAGLVTFFLLSGKKTDIDLNSYAEVAFSGTDSEGYGDITININQMLADNPAAFAVNDKNREKIQNKLLTGSTEEIDLGPLSGLMDMAQSAAGSLVSDDDLIRTLFSPNGANAISAHLSKSTGLSNGDTVQFIWDVDDELISSLFNVNLLHSNQEIEVAGLSPMKAPAPAVEAPAETEEPMPEETEMPAETPEETPAPTETPEPTAAPTETPTPTDEPLPTKTGIPAPTAAPTATPTATPAPTAAPTATPAPTAAPAADGYGTYHVIDTDYVTLRASASMSAEAVTRLGGGNQVKVLQFNVNGYYEVEAAGQHGYVLASYLLPDEGATANVPSKTLTIQGDYLTLRDIPATNGVELAHMNGGETVEYFGTAENNYYLIRYNGTMGYAMAQYLK